MPLGIVIPALAEEPMYIRQFSGLSDYQEVVEGLIEAVDLTTPEEATMFANEEGRLVQLDFNVRASLIATIHNPVKLFPYYMLLGNVVLIGTPDEEGDTQDVPQSYVDLLLKTEEYKILVQTVDDKDAWNGNARRFTDLVEAYEHAHSLSQRWFAVEQIKVVPS